MKNLINEINDLQQSIDACIEASNTTSDQEEKYYQLCVIEDLNDQIRELTQQLIKLS